MRLLLLLVKVISLSIIFCSDRFRHVLSRNLLRSVFSQLHTFHVRDLSTISTHYLLPSQLFLIWFSLSKDCIFLRSHYFPKLVSHQPCTVSPGLRNIFLSAAQSSPSCLLLKEFIVVTNWIKSRTLGIIFSCFPSIAPASFRFSTMTRLSQLIEQVVWESWPIYWSSRRQLPFSHGL